ncbi:hypothetical protein AB0M46_13700 [Dactylosporangium sp. NPDC051485]|uniref:hypothetical protein n=1 Tax=Dactylosporangium sp. NPDC051485 TaxID=3154846 RepID=UPI003425EB9E
MSSPAPIASRADWDDVIDAIQETSQDIRDLRDEIADRRAEREGDDTVTDPDRADLDEVLERERLDRLDYETDGRLDGDYDPDPDPRDYDLDD